MMELTNEQIEKLQLEYGREMQFSGYSIKEIYQLGMVDALDILDIKVPGVVVPTDKDSTEKTSREILREDYGYIEEVLSTLTDEECTEHLEAIEMYPEG